MLTSRRAASILSTLGRSLAFLIFLRGFGAGVSLSVSEHLLDGQSNDVRVTPHVGHST